MNQWNGDCQAREHGQPYKVLVVEDDAATRDRIVNIIRSSNSLTLQGAAGDFNEAQALVQQTKPDVLLTDLQLPDGNGIDLIRLLSGAQTKALVLTVMGDETSVIEAIRAGASGYLLKDDDEDDILKSLSQLLAGEAPLSPSIARYLLKHLSVEASLENERTDDVKQASVKLTLREVDVLNLIAKGYTYVEIADILCLSVHTIGSHVKNIYKKLGVSSRGEAVFEAMQMGMLSRVN